MSKFFHNWENLKWFWRRGSFGLFSVLWVSKLESLSWSCYRRYWLFCDMRLLSQGNSHTIQDGRWLSSRESKGMLHGWLYGIWTMNFWRDFHWRRMLNAALLVCCAPPLYSSEWMWDQVSALVLLCIWIFKEPNMQAGFGCRHRSRIYKRI